MTAALLVACATLLCTESRLPQMPLPKQALGPDAASLSRASDSGVDSNASAARNAGRGTTAADLARQGRLTGYILDYTAAGAGSRTLLGIETIAELYRSRATAIRGLAFWRGVTRRLDGTRQNGVAIALTPFAARVGDGAFAYELTYRIAGRKVGYVGDVVFRTDDLLGAVFVTTAEEAGLRTRTVALAQKLLARMKAALAGRIR